MDSNLNQDQKLQTLRAEIRQKFHQDEDTLIQALSQSTGTSDQDRASISARAAHLIRSVRESSEPALMENFLAEYGLSTREGVALMCLAEALLRVPDSTTIDDLIQDKIAPHEWSKHLGHSNSFLVNASTWGLMFTGKVLDEADKSMLGTVKGLVKRLGEPVIRMAISQAMKEMGAQFVLGRTIHEAYQRGQKMQIRGYTHSFDMLGEAAMTEEDAQKYHGAYAHAIIALTPYCTHKNIRENPGISVKLSALHPRYDIYNREEAINTLAARTLQLAMAAKSANMGFNIDAEEANRLDMSLDIIEKVLSSDDLKGWDGFGIVVQAYGKRAAPTLDWLYALAEKYDRKIMVRLVKGAYWDSEVKKAQLENHDDYPVFTRKVNTDVSYMACANKLLNMRDRIYPQFATHNAHSVATILNMAGEDKSSFEFQRLHGMGETLHAILEKEYQTRCRIYAPVGEHKDLLAYLVRRLLENGANSSFVNQIVDTQILPETIAKDPVEQAQSFATAFNTDLNKPQELFGQQRKNSKGWNLANELVLADITEKMAAFKAPYQWSASPLTQAKGDGAQESVMNPAFDNEVVGTIQQATPAQAQEAIAIALDAQRDWASTSVQDRAAILRKAADLFEDNAAELFAILQREAGKTINDAISEVREAVDFLRYYAKEAKHAERETQARGVIVCVSPWNFPLAIFIGQISAALVTGNTVVAKSAEQTPLVAHKAVQLLLKAGITPEALHLIPGKGADIGQTLVSDPRIAGVCFTGSTATAQTINKAIADNADSDAILIAETGGLNAMIMDSSALPEQVVRDVVASAFQSAGQRCSALRVLFVQKDVEEKVINMICGAMDQLSINDPSLLRTDVGPVIDQKALSIINNHCQNMESQGKLIKKLEVPAELTGSFAAPTLIRLNSIDELQQEIFGPVLHVVSYDVNDFDAVTDSINKTGYGLTFGVHSRIDGRVQKIVDAVNVGNYYVNRNQIGAVVGSQPFGGHGLSGTGPKAGGPLYLRKFRQSSEVAQAVTETANTKAVNIHEINNAILQLEATKYADKEKRTALVRSALKGEAKDAMSAAVALDMTSVELPGPTGESNQYHLEARGLVLCLGESPEALLAQTTQALVTGNKVVAVLGYQCKETEAAFKRLAKADLPVVLIHGTLDFSTLAEVKALDLVALNTQEDKLKQVKQALCSRSGAIVSVISDILYPGAYVHEKTVSTDTTAAGGNAQLLAEMS